MLHEAVLETHNRDIYVVPIFESDHLRDRIVLVNQWGVFGRFWPDHAIMQWNPRGYPREMVADPVLFIEQKKSEACIARYGTDPSEWLTTEIGFLAL